MGKDILTFEDIKIYNRHKCPILLRDVDIEKILVFNKISLGQKSCKYFIGYLYDNH